MDALYQAALRAGDFAFGWLLALPRDAAIVLVAAGTASLLVLVRLFTTDQDLLGRCRQDRRTLAGRIRRARAHAHGEDGARLARAALDALGREGLDVPPAEEGRLRRLVGRWHRRRDAARLSAVKQRVALKALRQEALPLLVVIVPIALLATWCFARLAWMPPRGGEGIEVVAHYPLTEAGQIVHLVPQDGMTCEGGWVREAEAETGGPKPYARAVWMVHAGPRQQPYALIVRSDRGQYAHELLVGQRAYSAPVRLQGTGSGGRALEVRLRPARPFGVVPGIPAIGFQPWLVGYLLITIPLVPLLKRTFHIY